jgi:hypothetical protein
MAKAARRSPKSSKTASEPSEQSTPNAGLITATIDTATGKIVEVVSIDGAGAPEKLTTDRRAKLSKQTGGASLEDLFAEAFEAGIACVLGGDSQEADDEASETADDIKLRRQILQQMIEHSGAQRLMQKDVLGRAIARTLIQKAVARSHASPARHRSPAH